MMRAIGRMLRGKRAGPEHRVAEDIRFAGAPRTLALISPAFEAGATMPESTTSPPLAWTGVPAGTQSLVLVVEDLDVPFPRPFVHAVAYGIDPAATHLDAGALDPTRMPGMGYNSGGGRRYVAPAPLPGHGAHRYVFTLLAVAFVPHFDQAPTRGRLLDAIAGHVLALAELTGTRER